MFSYTIDIVFLKERNKQEFVVNDEVSVMLRACPQRQPQFQLPSLLLESNNICLLQFRYLLTPKNLSVSDLSFVIKLYK